MDDRRKKGEFVGALGALLVHVAVIALLILVSYKPISAKSNIRATGDKTHILLIQGDQLKRLKDNLTRCLQK